jgi:bacterioferritin
MKGNAQIIASLNALLADELTAVSQYMVHAAMCNNWGYSKLHGTVEHIDRILFLEGIPVVSKLKKMAIGAKVEVQFANDHEAEDGAIKAYNEAIRLAVELGDNGTRQMLENILKDEETHIDWIEAQLDQISQMGIQNYLVEQT